MRRLRAIFGLAAVSAAVASAWFAYQGPAARTTMRRHIANRTRIMDRRCRGGCAANTPVTNLILQSQTFGTTWTAENVSVTANTMVAPDGTATADTITDTALNAQHRIYQSIALSAGATYTMTLYVKPGTASFVGLGINNFLTFNVSTCAYASGTGATYSIAASSGGFCKITLTDAPSGAGAFFIINMGTTSGQAAQGAYVGAGSTIVLWGAQLVAGSSAGCYVPTTTIPVTGTGVCY